ncbi:FAD-dependent oxidoreductase [Nocardia nepalensis]|uniref:FAD-dependent oxidoreductase n=1 Tax=Nocardia nepalensis TaxID=3375448 RepID=UPI003B67FFC9
MSHNDIRVAVVGSGPSGFYTAGALLAEDGITVDMFDRLPTPFGLVRAGVAPDHPKIKSVTRVFEKIARDPRFRFLGNVQVGRDVLTGHLALYYDAVVYAHGADRGRFAGVPGDSLTGNHTATEVVGWYNSHPDRADLELDLTGARAVVIGNGNVALDVTRILALPAERLAATDIADHALAALRRSRLREIVVLGRRGAEDAAFTVPELLELGELPDVDVVVDPAELPGTHSALSDSAQEKVAILREYARRPQRTDNRRIVLRFHTTPVAVDGDEHVRGIRVRRTADRTGDASERLLTAGLVVHAVGYTGSPLSGLPFDAERGIVPNLHGRILDADTVIPGQYVSGWIKRGPTGIIGTNRVCAQDTADSVLADLRAGLLPPRRIEGDRDAAVQLLRHIGVEVVNFDGWKAIDEHECALGRPTGRPRVKLARLPELLAVGASPAASIDL